MNATAEGLPLGAHERAQHAERCHEARTTLDRTIAEELRAGLQKIHEIPGKTAYHLLEELLRAAHALFKDCRPVPSNSWQHDAVSLAVDEFFATAAQRLVWGRALGHELQLMQLGDKVFVHAPKSGSVPIIEPAELLAAVIEHASERAYLQMLVRTYDLRAAEADLLVRMNARARPVFSGLIAAIGNINRVAYGDRVHLRQGASLFVMPGSTDELSLHHPAHGARIDLFGVLQPCTPSVFTTIVNAVGSLKSPETIAALYTIQRETAVPTPSFAPTPT